MSRPVRVPFAVALLAALALAAAPVRGDDDSTEHSRNDLSTFVERWRKEAAIERHMALAEVRGILGLYEAPAKPDWSARTSGKGRLEVLRGVPVLRLEGTPEEMGEQAGHLVGHEARALMDSYLPAFVGGRRELEKARGRARRLFLPHLTDAERRELEAFARASGLSSDDVLLAQGFADLYRLWSCTAIGAVGKSTAQSADGPLLARNLDFVDMGFLHRYSYVVVARPEGKEPYVSVSWPGLIGVLSGMNRSVSLAVLVVHDEHDCHEGVPFQLAFRRALETATSEADVEATLRALPITVTNNLAVVDAKGGAAVLELSPSGVVARGPDARGRLLATNHFLSDERRETRASLTYLSSRRRLAAAEKVCEAADVVTVDVAVEGLRAAEMPITVQSMVFLPRSGELRLALGKPPAAKRDFVRLERRELLGDSKSTSGLGKRGSKECSTPATPRSCCSRRASSCS